MNNQLCMAVCGRCSPGHLSISSYNLNFFFHTWNGACSRMRRSLRRLDSHTYAQFDAFYHNSSHIAVPVFSLSLVLSDLIDFIMNEAGNYSFTQRIVAGLAIFYSCSLAGIHHHHIYYVRLWWSHLVEKEMFFSIWSVSTHHAPWFPFHLTLRDL